MKNIRIYLCALACVLSCAMPANAATTSLQSGIANYRSGQYAVACQQLMEAVHERPQDAYSNYWYALSLLQMHRYSDALNEFTACRALDSELRRADTVRRLSKDFRDPILNPINSNRLATH